MWRRLMVECAQCDIFISNGMTSTYNRDYDISFPTRRSIYQHQLRIREVNEFPLILSEREWFSEKMRSCCTLNVQGSPGFQDFSVILM